ncbi:MAG: metalloregulator ArsR/SmtB family transcription factor [Phycisphaerales bacterium]|nr:helix-turn-helix transcriptional regulator [Planctomycetota bacterium]MCH8507668.1 metalloregulator ArsR/SmtB family transcription factor [Phycisphaerales bacterium]
MPRPPATRDVFLAIAEPRRRDILSLLGRVGESGVGAIAVTLDMAQPAASKHLGVLREAGVVRVRRDGRQRLYSLQADRLRAVHEWTRTFERYWSSQTDRIKARAEQAAGPGPHAPETTP